MATFRCKRSGNTINISLPQDIEELRKHEGYEEVKNEEIPVEKSKETVQETNEARPVLKLRGRPKKTH